MLEPIEGLDVLIKDMFDTMYDAPGIGLAAPQIGILERFFVMDTAKDEPANPKVFINPEIIWASEDTVDYEEGCLSIPQIYETVKRPSEVVLKYRDAKFIENEEKFTGLDATCVQHELDHLDGKLFVDYLSQLKRSMITKKMQKLKREITREEN